MRRFATGVLAGLVLLAAGSPAPACINDSEVDKAEREFKSSYEKNTPRGTPAPDYAPPPKDRGLPLAFLGTGSVLLAGAAVVCFKKTGGRA
jgi:hypothetical protein